MLKQDDIEEGQDLKKVKTEHQATINPFPQDADDEEFQSISEYESENSEEYHSIWL